ncbi:hypothetical protein SGPA1_31414 [Streptomyces misionensis JCM 4497]
MPKERADTGAYHAPGVRPAHTLGVNAIARAPCERFARARRTRALPRGGPARSTGSSRTG